MGIEPGAALGHELDDRVVVAVAVLDAPAARLDARGEPVGAVGVDHRAQPHRLRLRAHRLELPGGHHQSAALADARRGEHLDHVRPVVLQAAHERADLLRRPRAGPDRAQRGEHPGAGQDPAGDGVAQVAVGGAAEALHGGEAGHQGRPGVLGRVEDGLGRRLVRVGVGAPFGVEVRGQMHVGVDEPRHEGEPGQVVGDRPGVSARGRRLDGADARSGDAHDDVLAHVAEPVEEPAGPDGDGVLLRLGDGRRQRQADCRQCRSHRRLLRPFMPPSVRRSSVLRGVRSRSSLSASLSSSGSPGLPGPHSVRPAPLALGGPTILLGSASRPPTLRRSGDWSETPASRGAPT